MPENDDPEKRLITEQDAASWLAGALREFAEGTMEQNPERTGALLTIYRLLAADRGSTGEKARNLAKAAFCHYRPVNISADTAQRLYGRVLQGNVTRLETAAKCYLQQFLKYGLRLKEREEYEFEDRDSGDILHSAVQLFGEKLCERGIAWNDFTKEAGREIADEVLTQAAAGYRDMILYDSERSRYRLGQMQRILERTVDTLQYQLQRGDFIPSEYEVDFGRENPMVFPLSGGRQLRLTGRIDRVDTAVREGTEYIKILDYKSGNHDLAADKIESGQQLQLMLYMDAVLRAHEKRNGTSGNVSGNASGNAPVPAALLYYHFGDPMMTKVPASGEDAAKQIRKQLQPKGMVSSDDTVLELLDRSMETDPPVIPASRKKNGELSERSKVFSDEEYRRLSDTVHAKICEIAESILDGDIAARPVKIKKDITACTWCPFANVCGFDLRIPGYEFRDR